jgi:adenine deaminase
MYLDHDVVNVIGVIHKSLVTELLEEKIELEYGKYNYSNEDIQKIAVIERHGHSSNVGLGLIKGLHIKGGAIATSIAHDSHNIIVAGDSDELMAKAVNELIKIKGGIVVVANEDIETFPLPIGGLMTDLSMEEIAIKTDDIKSFARKKLSIPYNSEPFMTLSFMALPVIPEVKITDQGLFNVNTQQFISLEVEREA